MTNYDRKTDESIQVIGYTKYGKVAHRVYPNIISGWMMSVCQNYKIHWLQEGTARDLGSIDIFKCKRCFGFDD